MERGDWRAVMAEILPSRTSGLAAQQIRKLKNDKRAIFTAASYAQRAADYLHGLQKQGEAAA